MDLEDGLTCWIGLGVLFDAMHLAFALAFLSLAFALRRALALSFGLALALALRPGGHAFSTLALPLRLVLAVAGM